MLQSGLATGILTSKLKMCLQTGLKSFADALATFILAGRLSLLLYQVHSQSFVLTLCFVIDVLDGFKLLASGL